MNFNSTNNPRSILPDSPPFTTSDVMSSTNNLLLYLSYVLELTGILSLCIPYGCTIVLYSLIPILLYLFSIPVSGRKGSYRKVIV